MRLSAQARRCVQSSTCPKRTAIGGAPRRAPASLNGTPLPRSPVPMRLFSVQTIFARRPCLEAAVQPVILRRMRADLGFDHRVQPGGVGEIVTGRIPIDRAESKQPTLRDGVAKVAVEHDG